MNKTMKYIERMCVVLMLLCTFFIYLWSSEVREHRTPNGFNLDYKIDLKPEGYNIVDEDNQIHYVNAGELECWFLNDNL
jgi:hypothetical protein